MKRLPVLFLAFFVFLAFSEQSFAENKIIQLPVATKKKLIEIDTEIRRLNMMIQIIVETVLESNGAEGPAQLTKDFDLEILEKVNVSEKPKP